MAQPILFSNNIVTTLQSNLAIGATTITLAPGGGAGLPSPTGGQFFTMTLIPAAQPSTAFEVVYCTARSGDVLTVTRAQEGTANQAWLAGDVAYNSVTAGAMSYIYQLLATTNGGAYIGYLTQDAETITVKQYLDRMHVNSSLTMIQPRFEANNTDDSDTPDSAFRVNRTLTTTTASGHGFRDQTSFTRVAAYAAFDAAVTMNQTGMDHCINFQARSVMAGGTLTNWYGYGSFPIANAGTVTNMFGSYIRGNWSGAGNVTNNYGFYVENITKGTNKWAGYIAINAAPFYCGAPTQIDNLATFGGGAQLAVGGSNSADYPAITYNYNPRTNQYIASDYAAGFVWTGTSLNVRRAAAGSGGGTPSFSNLLQLDLTTGGSGGALTAGTDNSQTLGSSAVRWSTVYAATGTINTSDAREKTPLSTLSDDEIKAAAQIAKEIGWFKFLHAVDQKGEDARIHVGLTVQRVMEIMQANNLDPLRYAFICHDVWEDKFEDHPAIYAQKTIPAEYKEHEAEYIEVPEETVTEKVNAKIEGEIREVEIERVIPAHKRCIKEAFIETVKQAEIIDDVENVIRDAHREKITEAGDRYGFRTDGLMFFIARGLEDRLQKIEKALNI